MKVFISVDMEGVCGVTEWDEVTKGKDGYEENRRQMTAEAAAACRGALAAGATEIVVRDAHDTACNIIAADLPGKTQLIRGWSRHPYMMMQGLDSSFDAVFMIGYHACAMGTGNPLAHTMNTTRNASLFINGRLGSEFMINLFIARYERVPVILVSGDEELCLHATDLVPGIHAVSVKSGSGSSTMNIHPQQATVEIEAAAQAALAALAAGDTSTLPENFVVELNYTNHKDAYKASFYPGAILNGARSVSFTAADYFEVLRFLLFTF